MQATMEYPRAAEMPRLGRFTAYTGHALIATMAGLFGLMLLISGEYGPIYGFVIPIIAASVVAVALGVRFARWGHIFGAILGLVALAMAGPALGDAFEAPDSFFDFVPVLAGVSGGALTLVTAVAAVLRRDPSRVQVPVAVSVVVILLVAAGASGIATIAGRENVSAAERQGTTAVQMKGVEFTQEQLTAVAGQPVRFVVDNDDPVIHTFTIKGTEVDVSVKPGSSKLVEFTAPAAGAYEIICEITGHGGMKSTLIVQ